MTTYVLELPQLNSKRKELILLYDNLKSLTVKSKYKPSVWIPSGYSPPPGSTRITSLPRAPWCRLPWMLQASPTVPPLVIHVPTFLIWFYKVINIWAPKVREAHWEGCGWIGTGLHTTAACRVRYGSFLMLAQIYWWHGGEGKSSAGISLDPGNPSLMCLFNQESRLQSQSPEQARISYPCFVIKVLMFWILFY